MKQISKNSGFSLVEVLVGAAIIVVSVLAVMAVTEKSVAMSRRALHTLQASYLLEEGAEAMRILRDDAWSNVSTLSPSTDYYLEFSGGTWTVSTTPSLIGIFTRVINIENVNRDFTSGDIDAGGTDDPQAKLATLTISWQEGGETINKTLSFYVMDIFAS